MQKDDRGDVRYVGHRSQKAVSMDRETAPGASIEQTRETVLLRLMRSTAGAVDFKES